MASNNSGVKTKREHKLRVEQNVFEVLQQYDISLSTKVKNILTRLEFRDLRSISMIDSVDELQSEIISLIKDESFMKTLAEQDKIDLFGMFSSDPKYFKFMPGEKNSLKAAIQLSRQILQRYSEDYVYKKPEIRKRKKLQSRPESTVSTLSNDGNGKSNTEEMTERESESVPVLKKKKTLSQYVNHWLKNTKMKVSDDYVDEGYTVDDFKSTIQCIAPGCEKLYPFRASVDVYDGWKVSTFVRHVQLVHLSKQSIDPKNGTIPTNNLTKSINPNEDAHPGSKFDHI